MIDDILDNIRIGFGLDFRIGDDWLQVVDPNLPPAEGRGRKWRLSEHMTRSEIVQTAFAAYLAFLEHEARETFTYMSQPIFGPHYDVDALASLAVQQPWDFRAAQETAT